MREYSATVGDTDGNIIAAIITVQTPTNQPSVPRLVPGPASSPSIRSPVHHHASAASANSSAIRPSRARAAANAGARPCGRASLTEPIIGSGSPGELRRGEPGPALVG